MKSRRIFRKLRGCEGQALAEYALIITFIALVCVAALALLGGTLRGFFAGFAGSF
ncbi:MAG: Flp family type IVb pilin [Gemmatimonadota bacterium]